MKTFKEILIGIVFTYAVIAFCVGTGALVDLLFGVVPAVCK